MKISLTKLFIKADHVQLFTFALAQTEDRGGPNQATLRIGGEEEYSKAKAT